MSSTSPTPMTTTTKSAVTSTGFLGSLLAIIAGAATTYQAAKSGDAVTAYSAGTATLGGIVALVGRIKATKQITSLF